LVDCYFWNHKPDSFTLSSNVHTFSDPRSVNDILLHLYAICAYYPQTCGSFSVSPCISWTDF
jgi:hypothetical protein